MRFFPRFGGFGTSGTSGANEHASDFADTTPPEESHLLRTIGLVSAALGAVAIGLVVGREVRRRYKFNRRTPYDLYSHSGDELADADCGVGI